MTTFEKLRGRKGQGTVEYVMIIAIVVAAIFIFKDKLKGLVSGSGDALQSKVTEGINSMDAE